MANFDMLNTGNSGIDATFGNEEVLPEVQEEIAEQQRELANLLPSVQQILEVIDEEIGAIADIRSYIKVLVDAPTKKSIEAEYHARELYIEFLERLKSSIAEKVTDVVEINQ